MSILLDLVFPRTCYVCGVPDTYLCTRCQKSLVYKGLRYSRASLYDGRVSMFRYHGVIKKIITDLKFSFVSNLTFELTMILVSGLINRYPHILRHWQEDNYTLIPIPLYPSRHNWRGFNQSELICQKLADELSLRYDPNLLTRTKDTIPQTTIKDKRLRRTNTQSSFALSFGTCPDNVIIFDDVYTTGSTVRSAISVFPKSTHIWVLTIAG